MQHPAAYKNRGFTGRTFVFILRYAANVAYIAGLTALIPLVIFPTEKAPNYFSAAAGLIIFATLVIFIQKRSLGLTIRTLGRITIIPGILAVLFLMFGRENSVNFVLAIAPSLAEPIAKSYIENSIPSIWLLALGFSIVGMVLWLMGSKMVRKMQYAEITHFRHRIEHLK